MIITAYNAHHFKGVDALWRVCFPDDPPRNQAAQSIPAKLAMKDDLFFIAEDDAGQVVGTIMAGWDGHRGWLYTVAVSPPHRRSGLGKELVDAAIHALKRRGCNKVNLQIRAGNEAVAKFYEECGFVVEQRTSMGRGI